MLVLGIRCLKDLIIHQTNAHKLVVTLYRTCF